MLAAGMKDWSVADWTGFFALLAGFVTVTLTPAILLIISKINGLRSNMHAVNSDMNAAIRANSADIVKVALNSTPPTQLDSKNSGNDTATVTDTHQVTVSGPGTFDPHPKVPPAIIRP